MENGRFGPIETNNKPKKTYRVDYNRLITLVMIIAIVVLGVIIFVDASRQDEEQIPFQMTLPDNTVGTQDPAVVTDKKPEDVRPLPEEEGMLPIFRIANTDEKKVAIVISDIPNASNLETLIGLCGTFSAKVTFFPTGEEALAYSSLWTNAVFAGHEIENHTMDNTRLSTLMDEDKAKAIENQTHVLRAVIGSGYVPHFLMTSNLEDDSDAFIHSWLAGNNYMGIVRYDEYMPKSFSEVRPGAVLSYPLTNEGLKALKQAIPVLSENGYQMVTLNELFLYPDNFESDGGNAG